jgi:hypothetical protein|tara:strand:- start:3329 stop:3748 length:420 start_codon:yes stop_codon:yes gene_type:complete
MATTSQWTVVFDDKIIICQLLKDADGHSTGYKIDDDAFWSDSKWSNIWAIQYKDDNHDYNDTIEYRDDTPHATWANAGLGDFRTQFVDKWDVAHLAALQNAWDEDVIRVFDNQGNITSSESEADQIARKGARPTSFSSY